MDGRTRYNKICNVLKPIVNTTIDLQRLKRRVIIDIGTSETVIRETIQLMIDLGMIREVRNMVYKVISSEAKI